MSAFVHDLVKLFKKKKGIINKNADQTILIFSSPVAAVWWLTGWITAVTAGINIYIYILLCKSNKEHK